MRPRNGVASGVLMLLAGAFLVLRTVRRPSGGRNLVDLILGDGGAAESAANTAAETNANNLLNLPSLTNKPQVAPTPATGNRTNNRAPGAGH
jgi:hypothetical protein